MGNGYWGFLGAFVAFLLAAPAAWAIFDVGSHSKDPCIELIVEAGKSFDRVRIPEVSFYRGRLSFEAFESQWHALDQLPLGKTY